MVVSKLQDQASKIRSNINVSLDDLRLLCYLVPNIFEIKTRNESHKKNKIYHDDNSDNENNTAKSDEDYYIVRFKKPINSKNISSILSSFSKIIENYIKPSNTNCNLGHVNKKRKLNSTEIPIQIPFIPLPPRPIENNNQV